MFCDQATIIVKAGNGGNGSVSWRRLKYMPKGGPDGGNGGKGGSVFFLANKNLNTLQKYVTKKQWKSDHGENGYKRDLHGKNGEDLILEVPIGTILFDEDTGEKIDEIVDEGKMIEIVRGGRGGYGNAHFCSSVRQAPDFSEIGEPGEEKTIKLELKLVADVGIIGIPSVGKSTLISNISHARPKIADYPFTTLVPNLGIAKVSGETIVVADIPGLIEGAHEGKGLGDTFLRHISRNNILIHLLDGNDPDIISSYHIIQKELEKYDETLLQKSQIIVINKSDLLDTDCQNILQSELKKNIPPKTKIFFISAATSQGITPMMKYVLEVLKKEQAKQEKKEEITSNKPFVFRPHLEEDPRFFEVIQEEDGVFRVTGKRIEQIAVMTNMQQKGGVDRLYDVIEKLGIYRELQNLKLEEGTLFRISIHELPYREKILTRGKRQ